MEDMIRQDNRTCGMESTCLEFQNFLDQIYNLPVLQVVSLVLDQVSQVDFPIHQPYLQFLEPLLAYHPDALPLLGLYHLSQRRTAEGLERLLDHGLLLNRSHSQLIFEVGGNVLLLLLYLHLLGGGGLLISLEVLIVVLLEILLDLFLNFLLFGLLEGLLLLGLGNGHVGRAAREGLYLLELMVDVFDLNVVDGIEDSLEVDVLGLLHDALLGLLLAPDLRHSLVGVQHQHLALDLLGLHEPALIPVLRRLYDGLVRLVLSHRVSIQLLLPLFRLFNLLEGQPLFGCQLSVWFSSELPVLLGSAVPHRLDCLPGVLAP